MAHHAPDLELVIDGDWNAGVVRILWLQLKASPVLHKALQGKFAVACIRVLGGVIANTDAQQSDHLGAGGKDNNQFQ